MLIAVIGKRWLVSSDEKGRRRLDNLEDFVRLEIATALRRGIRVIPVPVDGASMPRSGDLPDDLNALARRNALEVGHTRFNADSERLISALEGVLRTARTVECPPPGREMPEGAVLISYAREDLSAVQRLKAGIEAASLTVWFDSASTSVFARWSLTSALFLLLQVDGLHACRALLRKTLRILDPGQDLILRGSSEPGGVP